MIERNLLSAFVIRKMRTEDIPEVTLIDQASFSLPWPANAYEYELKRNENSLVYVAELGEDTPHTKLIGVIVVWLILDEAHIATLAVHPDYRQQGVAQKMLLYALIQSAKRGAQKATLEVREHNHIAQHLYQRFGFKKVGRRKHYYRDNNEDALIMTVEPLHLAHLEALWETLVEVKISEQADQKSQNESLIRKLLWKQNRN